MADRLGHDRRYSLEISKITAELADQGIEHGRRPVSLGRYRRRRGAPGRATTRPGAVVLNAAGWTDVDGAEQHEAEATAVNGTSVEGLAQACRSAGALLVHVSTDYVFGADGLVVR